MLRLGARIKPSQQLRHVSGHGDRRECFVMHRFTPWAPTDDLHRFDELAIRADQNGTHAGELSGKQRRLPGLQARIR